MSDEKFPLPGSSYKELSKIIAAYATISGATAPGPVGQIAVVHETVVSRNNKFLVATRLIEGGQKKTCSALGATLGRAIQHDQHEAISSAWQTVVSETDFFQKIISAVRIRRGMEESALASHIAFTAGSGKNAYARAGAGAIIEILQLANVITADGSTLVAVAPPESSSQESSSSSEMVWIPKHTNKEHGTTLLRAEGNHRRDTTGAQSISRDPPSGVRLIIDLRIACTSNELDGWGTKLRKLREEFEGSIGDTNISAEVQMDTPPIPAEHDSDQALTEAPSQDDEFGK